MLDEHDTENNDWVVPRPASSEFQIVCVATQCYEGLSFDTEVRQKFQN
jgi:hypothetical protein